MRIELSGVGVTLSQGAVRIDAAERSVLVQAPPGASALVVGAPLPICAIVVPSGTRRSVAGLLEVLLALEAQGKPITVHVPVEEDRAATLVEAFTRCWPDAMPVVVDSHRSGSVVEEGPFRIRTLAVSVGDLRFGPGGERRVEATAGWALRIEVGTVAIAFISGIASQGALRSLCNGADLAVIECGVTDWPVSGHPLRHRQDQAVQLGLGARTVWLVGDDGQPIVGDKPC